MRDVFETENTPVEHPSPKPKRRKKNFWPNIYTRTHRTGSKSWVVDLGEIDGKRERYSFKSKEEANTFAEQARIKKQNEGLAAFSLPGEVRADALRASEILKPHGISVHQAALELVKARQVLGPSNVSLPQASQEYAKAHVLLGPHGVSLGEAVQYYDNHVLKYRNARYLPSPQPEPLQVSNGHQNGPMHGNGYHRPQQQHGQRNVRISIRPEQWKCSPKQQELILRIVRENGGDKDRVEQLSQELFGAGVKQLNKLQASGLIDELLQQQANQPAGGRV